MLHCISIISCIYVILYQLHAVSPVFPVFLCHVLIVFSSNQLCSCIHPCMGDAKYVIFFEVFLSYSFVLIMGVHSSAFKS